MNAKNKFKELYQIAKTDPNIIGFFFSGSRGKGLQTEFSDYDLYFIVKNSCVHNYKAKYPKKMY